MDFAGCHPTGTAGTAAEGQAAPRLGSDGCQPPVDLKNRCHFSTIPVTRPIVGRVAGISDALQSCPLRPQTPARVRDPSDGGIGLPRFIGRNPHPKTVASMSKISRGNPPS
jgi:hypothetical protein